MIFLGDFTSNSGEIETIMGTKQNYSPVTMVLKKVTVPLLTLPILTNINTVHPT